MDNTEIKDTLSKYLAAQGRMKMLNEGIQSINARLTTLETENTTVIDCVKGTRKDGTYGSIRIEGFPDKQYKKLKALFYKREEILRSSHLQLLDLTNKVEKFINSIEDPEIQAIFDLHYLNGRNWIQVSHDMNFKYGIKVKKYTESSCRLLHDRYLKKT